MCLHYANMQRLEEAGALDLDLYMQLTATDTVSEIVIKDLYRAFKLASEAQIHVLLVT